MAHDHNSLKGPALWAVFLLCLLSIVIGACSSAKHPPDSEGSSQVSPGGALPPVYPHYPGWNAPASHGGYVLQNGLSSCDACHQRGAGGGEGGAPACGSCHELYPHTDNWVARENHGAWVASHERNACATQCHGVDLLGGLSQVSCSRCHDAYPHSADWAEPARHGAAADGEGISTCRSCHGDDLRGGSSSVSCFRCHASFPHGGAPDQPWNGTGHGRYINEHAISECQACHGADYLGGASQRSCKREGCHPSFPHSTVSDWDTYAGHGRYVDEPPRSGNTSECQICHGSNLTRVLDGQNCFSCHPSYPHQGTDSVQWRSFEGHGVYTLGHSNTECASCHGADFRGGARGNPSCYSCHVSYPHTAGWSGPAGTPQGHGSYVNANSTASCATLRCHGVGLVPTPDVTRGTNCNACHTAAYPHAAGFRDGRLHGSPARADITRCKSCHGSGLDRAPTGYQSCVQCHASYLQHSSSGMGVVGWGTYEGHGRFVGPVASRNLTECRLCHGADYAGGVSGVGCMSCHASYPHPAAWREKAGHGDYVISLYGPEIYSETPVQCFACHGSDLMGGRSGVSCYSCHENYPHQGDGWISPRGEGSHTIPFKASYTSNSSDASCFDCHTRPAPFNATQTYETIRSDSRSCNACHWLYPHIGWNNTTRYNAREPVVGGDCGPRDTTGMGHMMYLFGNPRSLIRPSGSRLEQVPSGTPVTSTLWRDAVAYSCGGWFDGVCHYNGLRSYRIDYLAVNQLCGTYCHTASRPLPPVRPVCPPPPPPPPPPPSPCSPDEEYIPRSGLCCDEDGVCRTP